MRPLDDAERRANGAAHARAVAPVRPEIIALNNKSASLRALLHDNPDGLDYDQLSRYTGIARDKISASVNNLIRDGDAKRFAHPTKPGAFVFKFSGDAKRIGTRLVDEQPARKPTAETEPTLDGVPLSALGADSAQGLTEYNAQREREAKTAEPPPRQRAAAPQADAGSASSAAPKAAAPQRTEADAPPSSAAVAPPAAAAAPVQQTAGVTPPKVPATAGDAKPATPAAPAEPKRREQFDLMTELTIVAAANLAAEVRACDFNNGVALARALANFERADRLREEIKAERA